MAEQRDDVSPRETSWKSVVRRRTDGPRTPAGWLTPLVGLAVVVFGLLAAEAIAGAVTVGVSVDEPALVERFENWLSSGYYMPTSTLVDGRPDEADPFATPYVYGAAFSTLSHVANVALGHEALTTISSSPEAYATRRAIVALLGVGAACAVGLSVRVMTRDRLAALWAAAALLAIPDWTGRAMFNTKDIPAAAGFTLVTTGLIMGVAAAREEPSLRRRLAAGALVGAGVFLGVGTRPALWVPLGFSLALFAVLASLVGERRGKLARPPLAQPVGFGAGLALVAAIHPRIAQTPASWLAGSVRDSSAYPHTNFQLVAGVLVDVTDAPLWYLPATLFAGLPVLVLAVAAAGLVVSMRGWLSLLRRWTGDGGEAGRAASSGLVVVQLALLPGAAAFASNPGALSHHLYVLPAVAMLSGLGAHRLLASIRSGHGPVLLRYGTLAVLGLALLVPTAEQSRLYPYNYVYVNPLAGIRGVEGYWETESDWTSNREGFRRVPAGAEPACSADLVSTVAPRKSPVVSGCGPYLPPYLDEVGASAVADARSGEIWVVGRPRSANRLPDYCEDFGSVTRRLRGERIVMSYVLRCRPAAAERQASAAR